MRRLLRSGKGWKIPSIVAGCFLPADAASGTTGAKRRRDQETGKLLPVADEWWGKDRESGNIFGNNQPQQAQKAEGAPGAATSEAPDGKPVTQAEGTGIEPATPCGAPHFQWPLSCQLPFRCSSVARFSRGFLKSLSMGNTGRCAI